MPKNFTTSFATFVAVFAMAGVCEATGRYNLPSGIAQFFGNGFGPGYHADLVLGSSSTLRKPRGFIRRVSNSPRPSHTHGFHAGTSTLNLQNVAPPATFSSGYSNGSARRAVPPQHRHTAPHHGTRRAQPQPRRPGVEPASPSDAPVAEGIPLP